MSKYYLDRTRMDLEDDNELNLGDPDIIPRTKPLRWRTGPVPKELVVFYEWNLDTLGIVHGAGQGNKYGDIIDRSSIIGHEKARWLPLSEILALVEG